MVRGQEGGWNGEGEKGGGMRGQVRQASQGTEINRGIDFLSSIQGIRKVLLSLRRGSSGYALAQRRRRTEGRRGGEGGERRG